MSDIRAMRDVFLQNLLTEMENNDQIFFLSADFGSPVLDKIRERFPKRFLNVGIAEQNLINISVGLALEGFSVFAYAIAPFITMRCFEQIRVNLAVLSQIRPMNVNLIGVGAGYSYVVSGPTHQCLEDLTIMRSLPNLEFFSPSDWRLAGSFVKYALSRNTPKYIRLDAKASPPLYSAQVIFDFQKGFHQLSDGKSVCAISTGYMTKMAAEFLKGMDVGLIDVFMLNSIDEVSLAEILRPYSKLISIEEGFINKGGLDAFILEILNRAKISIPLKNLGLRNTYNFEMGSREHLLELAGAGTAALKHAISGL